MTFSLHSRTKLIVSVHHWLWWFDWSIPLLPCIFPPTQTTQSHAPLLLSFTSSHPFTPPCSKTQATAATKVTPVIPISNRVRPTASTLDTWCTSNPQLPAARTWTKSHLPSTIRALVGSQPTLDLTRSVEYRRTQTDLRRDPDGQLAQLIPAIKSSQTCHFFFFLPLCSKRSPLSSPRTDTMSPLRYKSNKDSTCNIRSSNFPLSHHLLPIRKYSVLLETPSRNYSFSIPLSSTAYTLHFMLSGHCGQLHPWPNILRGLKASQKLVLDSSLSPQITVLFDYIYNRLRVLHLDIYIRHLPFSLLTPPASSKSPSRYSQSTKTLTRFLSFIHRSSLFFKLQRPHRHFPPPLKTTSPPRCVHRQPPAPSTCAASWSTSTPADTPRRTSRPAPGIGAEDARARPRRRWPTRRNALAAVNVGQSLRRGAPGMNRIRGVLTERTGLSCEKLLRPLCHPSSG